MVLATNTAIFTGTIVTTCDIEVAAQVGLKNTVSIQ